MLPWLLEKYIEGLSSDCCWLAILVNKLYLNVVDCIEIDYYNYGYEKINYLLLLLNEIKSFYWRLLFVCMFPFSLAEVPFSPCQRSNKLTILY